MRMRKRHNLGPRMEACAAYLIEDPAAMRGEWLAAFPEQDRVYVELGCGKGRFTVELAQAEPSALILAIEKVPDAMILAMERAQAAGVTNIRFMDFDAANLPDIFAAGEIDRLFLNFSDPWPKSRDAKFRLTAPGFLRIYADLLSPEGQIQFKTDNGPLFTWSLEQFAAEGWALSEITDDLHKNGPVGIMTDYEAKFTAEGLKIHRLAARKTAQTKTTAAGPVPRLRNAALGDARGRRKLQPSEDAVSLTPGTLSLYHALFRDFEQAPELFEDKSKLRPYVYDPAKVDAWVAERLARSGERRFCIMMDREPIGELVLKGIDPVGKRCAMGICLKNDRFKNHGYGTLAERQGLRYAFEELGMETVLADSLLQNTRSQRALQKAGFRFVSEDAHFKYYQISREQFTGKQREEQA